MFVSLRFALALFPVSTVIVGVSFVATTLIVIFEGLLFSSPSFTSTLNTLFVVFVGVSEELLYFIASTKAFASAKLIFPLTFSKVKILFAPFIVAVILYISPPTVIFAIAFPLVKLREIAVPFTINSSFAPSKIEAVGIEMIKLCKSVVFVSAKDIPKSLNKTSFKAVSTPFVSVNVAIVLVLEIVVKLFLVIVTCDAAVFKFPAASFALSLAKFRVISSVALIAVTSNV